MRKYLTYLLLILLFIPFMVRAESGFLYDVLRDGVENELVALEYSGEHHDSFTEEPFKKIYHWSPSGLEAIRFVKERYNVIFANYCWQMIRTTDTGGVKMIYNGVPENGQCLPTRGVQVGYAPRTTQDLASNYWYGTDYSYDSSSKQFSITGTLEQGIWNGSTSDNLIGKYTCKSEDGSGTCDTIYYVESYNNEITAYVIPIGSNAHYSQFGRLQYNSVSSSPGDLGYMYNVRYASSSKKVTASESVLKSATLNTSFWYGTDAIWGTPVTKKYNLVGAYQVSSEDEYGDLVGKYTFRNGTSTYTYRTVQYIAAVNGSTYYQITLESGNDINYYNYTYTFGDSYTKNDDGTYTINNPTTIERKDWYLHYQDVANKYVCKNATNNTCDVLWYATATTATNLTYNSSQNDYTYSKSFSYDGSNYHLDGDSINIWDTSNSEDRAKVNNHHYTCFNTTGECSSIYYVYYIEGTTPFYITLTDGIDIEEAINATLSAEDVNQEDSLMKKGLELWYEHYLLDYDEYIEDTIYCNNRIVSSVGSFNPDGGDISEDLQFEGYSVIDDLSCKRDIDKFSTMNSKAKLNYKVGLATAAEMNLLRSGEIRYTGKTFWLMTPFSFYYNAGPVLRRLPAGGALYFGSLVGVTYSDAGVRPVISLKNGAKYSSGDGSTNNPFIFDKIAIRSSISVDIVKETEDLNIEIKDISEVEYGEGVTFKVIPIKGYKLTSLKILDSDNNEIEYNETDNKNEYRFVMPNRNVVITPSYERVANSVIVEDNSNTKEIEIKVGNTSAIVYEDKVVFTVRPEDGYEVERIEIIGSEGNILEYTNTGNLNEYEFIMPDTDVTIRPIYRKLAVEQVSNVYDNPETGDSLLIVLLLMMISFVMIVVSYKKKESML